MCIFCVGGALSSADARAVRPYVPMGIRLVYESNNLVYESNNPRISLSKSEYGLSLFQPFVIKHKALTDILVENLSRPLPETSGFLTVYPVADTDDGIEIIECLLTIDLTRTFLLNYLHFGNS